MALSTSVLITNFNTWELSRRCIDALNVWSSNHLNKILIIDDASTDVMPSDFPKNVMIIKNQENKGYVASVNIGFSYLNDDIVLLLDSDAYPKQEIIEGTSRIFENQPRLGALGFHLVGHDERATGSYVVEPSVWGLILGQKLESKIRGYIPSPSSKSLCLFSCAIAVRREAFEDIGGFDESFDFLDADIDFSIRLRKAGWDIQIDPNLKVFHEGGGSYQATSKRVLRHHSNRWRLLQKHGMISNQKTLKFILAIRHVIELSILKTLGKKLYPDPNVLSDKIYSRQQLLKQVWSGYGNESK